MTTFCCCCLQIKAKHQNVKYHNKNTGLFINCIDFVVVRSKINKKEIVIFFVMLGLCLNLNRIYCHASRIYFQCFETKKEAEKVEVNNETLKNRKKSVSARESNCPSDLTLMRTRSFIIDFNFFSFFVVLKTLKINSV
jgi:hypothetical protein